MRDTVDRFTQQQGGMVARFAGNFFWQVRFEDDGATQVCYKYSALRDDPVLGTDQEHKLTFLWEHNTIGRPGASTFGLNGTQGLYSRTNWAATAQFHDEVAAASARGQVEPPVHIGTSSPRNSGGFTVYRHSHWCLEGTQLQFGDVFGDSTPLLGYEVDGLDCEYRTREQTSSCLLFVGLF